MLRAFCVPSTILKGNKMICLRFIGFIGFIVVGMITMAGTASADGIPGTFHAVNTTNTVLQDGGGAFSSRFGFSGTWADRSGAPGFPNFSQFDGNGNSGTGVPGESGGFLAAGQVESGGDFRDGNIVTTLSGLAPGTYEVRVIYSARSNPKNLQYSVGFAAGDTTQVQAGPRETGNDNFEATNNIDGGFADIYEDVGVVGQSAIEPVFAFGSLIGEVTVSNGDDLQLFTDFTADADDPNVTGDTVAAINGFSLVQTSTAAVPEPSSLAILGLVGGLGLMRRRR